MTRGHPHHRAPERNGYHGSNARPRESGEDTGRTRSFRNYDSRDNRRSSRSRSPQRNSRIRRDARSRSPLPRHGTGRSDTRRRSPPPTDSRQATNKSRLEHQPEAIKSKEVEMVDVGNPEDENAAIEAAMKRVMGFTQFGTTKNKKVPGNEYNYGVRKEKRTEYRQYMNRQGGFNRPLSPG